MADERLKSDVVDNENDGSAEKLFGLPKKMVIIISAVLLFIIIGLAAFLLLGDEPEPEETTTEETITEEPIDNLLDNEDELGGEAEEANTESNAEVEGPSVSEKIDLLEQQLMTIQEQNIQLNETLLRVESYLANPKKSVQRQSNQQFLNQYGAENDASFPPVQTEPPAPKPKPHWGDFKRAN